MLSRSADFLFEFVYAKSLYMALIDVTNQASKKIAKIKRHVNSFMGAVGYCLLSIHGKFTV